MGVNGAENHFELRYYFAIHKLFVTKFHCTTYLNGYFLF